MSLDITSPQNPKIKHIVKLREDKRQRQKDDLILVEGYDELMLAFSCGLIPQTLLTAPELASKPLTFTSAETRWVEPVETFTVSQNVFEKISYRDNPDGWLGIFPTPKTSLDKIKLSNPALVIVAQSIEKPGNLGAILRTADAARVDAVLVCDPRVDIWNPNVIRASRGAVFALPVVEVESANALAWLKSSKMRVLAATPSADEVYSNVDMQESIAIAVGTEDKGLTDFWMQHADVKVQIPMLGKINSLNVSIATALLVYEALRQRS
ncbi:MAG: RNA methyltransferase [Anaerolineales bacterium]|nr:RNA methyltransferase [Anaerolineales bacterium]